MVEDDEATLRGSAEGAGSRPASSVATALGGVAVAEAQVDGGVEWRVVSQEGKPPREVLRDDESEPNDDPLPGDNVGWMDCD